MSLKPLKKTDQNKWWAAYKDRKPATRREIEYILVVSEDEKSSVYYFKALNERLRNNSATIEVIPHGVGRDTQSLIRFVQRNRRTWLAEVQKEVNIEDFNEVWVLFDKDDFKPDKFDNAVESGKRNGFSVGWSNECFELWYLLHFQDRVTGVARKDIYKALQKRFDLKCPYEDCKGKNGIDLHQRMAHNPDVRKAIKRAKRLYEAFVKSGDAPHEANPCTLVYQLVEKLLAQIVN